MKQKILQISYETNVNNERIISNEMKANVECNEYEINEPINEKFKFGDNIK